MKLVNITMNIFKITKIKIVSLALVAIVFMLGGASLAGAATCTNTLTAPTSPSASCTTTISAAISPVVSIKTSGAGTVPLAVTPSTAGLQSWASDDVTVATNDTTVSGFSLTLSSSTAQVTLNSGSNTIAASAGTFALPAALVANSWGYCVISVGGFATNCPATAQANQTISSTYKFAAIPASGSASTIANPTGPQDYGTPVVTTIWYSVAANTATKSGSYTDILVYTATVI